MECLLLFSQVKYTNVVIYTLLTPPLPVYSDALLLDLLCILIC